jgi:hypothetical protein
MSARLAIGAVGVLAGLAALGSRRGSRQWFHGAPRERCAPIELDGWIRESTVLQELPTLEDLVRAKAEVMERAQALERAGASEDDVASAMDEGMEDVTEASLTPMEGFAYAASDGAGRAFLKDSAGNCIYEVALTQSALVVPDEDWLGDLFLGEVLSWGDSRGRPRQGTVRDVDYRAWRKRLGELTPWRSEWVRGEIELIDEHMELLDEDDIALRAAVGRDLIAHLRRLRPGERWLAEGARRFAPSIAHEGPMRVVRRVDLGDPTWMKKLTGPERQKIKSKLAGLAKASQ